MTDKKTDNFVYSTPVIDFVTIAVEFCAFLEKEEQPSREEWIDKMVKVLPLMYVKASLLPEAAIAGDELFEMFVKESDYTRVLSQVADIMADEDTYLDVFVEDMKYSERPISAFVSENIADIYQDVRNFISVYQYDLTEQMNNALAEVKSNFKQYWGQKLVNVLRPLHSLKYADAAESDLEDDYNTEDLWD